MNREHRPLPEVMGICILGPTERMTLEGNEVRLDVPGAGIFVDDRGGGHKDLNVSRNSVTIGLAAVKKRWFDTYWVDVFSGSTVLVLAMFCAWLGLKS